MNDDLPSDSDHMRLSMNVDPGSLPPVAAVALAELTAAVNVFVAHNLSASADFALQTIGLRSRASAGDGHAMLDMNMQSTQIALDDLCAAAVAYAVAMGYTKA